MTNLEIREQLFALKTEEYKQFSIKLTPTKNQILGVRLPALRQLAKTIAKNNYNSYLLEPFTEYHEECLLYGLVLNYISCDIEYLIENFDRWTYCVDNWAVCDSVVMGLKNFGKKCNKERVFEYLISLLGGEFPFRVRIAIIGLFRYFIDDTSIDTMIAELVKVRSENYYVNMGLAWAICEIIIKHYAKGLEIIKTCKLEQWVHNKSISKACDSFRLTSMQKYSLVLCKIKPCSSTNKLHGESGEI